MVRPMVHSKKHYVQHSLRTIVAGAVQSDVIVDAVELASVGDADEVQEGSTVKAVYVERWIRTGDTAGGSFVMAIYKNPGGNTTFTAAQMAALHDAENKKNILYCTQGLANDQDADAIAMFKGWIKIPKSKQRMGLGDRIVISTFAQVLDMHNCGFETYKEYT